MKVKCIENRVDKKQNKECPQLTIGRLYVGHHWPKDGIFKHGVYLTDESGSKGWYSKHRFEVIDEK